ncbi:hypothetical protein BC830DRAFT_1076352 [Chytriomyces sp. MP71]|nr:hypothetical protein BC830DRAFT_1076352 [Chytriomyces sp. MP71]
MAVRLCSKRKVWRMGDSPTPVWSCKHDELNLLQQMGVRAGVLRSLAEDVCEAESVVAETLNAVDEATAAVSRQRKRREFTANELRLVERECGECEEAASGAAAVWRMALDHLDAKKKMLHSLRSEVESIQARIQSETGLLFDFDQIHTRFATTSSVTNSASSALVRITPSPSSVESGEICAGMEETISSGQCKRLDTPNATVSETATTATTDSEKKKIISASRIFGRHRSIYSRRMEETGSSAADPRNENTSKLNQFQMSTHAPACKFGIASPLVAANVFKRRSSIQSDNARRLGPLPDQNDLYGRVHEIIDQDLLARRGTRKRQCSSVDMAQISTYHYPDSHAKKNRDHRASQLMDRKLRLAQVGQ